MKSDAIKPDHQMDKNGTLPSSPEGARARELLRPRGLGGGDG